MSRTIERSPRLAAMNLLARREHSILELVRKLRERYDEVELRAAIEQLTSENLQSDDRFALGYTRERLIRGFGPRHIEKELRQRGVEDLVIGRALSAVPREEGTTWSQVATQVLKQKFGAGSPEDLPEKARRLRFLSQRGFTSETYDLVPDP